MNIYTRKDFTFSTLVFYQMLLKMFDHIVRDLWYYDKVIIVPDLSL